MGPNESRNLWISIGAGIFATFMLYSYSQEKKLEMEKAAGDKVKVVVARDDIYSMDTIYDDKLNVVEKNRAEVEPDALDSIPAVVGSVAAVPIKKGQTITRNILTEVGPETGLAIAVAPGKRPVTISISPERANANLIRPGDRVDVYAMIDTGKGMNQKRELSLFDQDVTVLATGVNVNNNLPRTIERDPSGKYIQTTLTGDTKYSNLTLEVKAEQVQDLIYINSTNPSSITLVLRNPNDRKPIPRMPSSSSDSIQSRTTGSSSQAAPNTVGNPGR